MSKTNTDSLHVIRQQGNEAPAWEEVPNVMRDLIDVFVEIVIEEIAADKSLSTTKAEK